MASRFAAQQLYLLTCIHLTLHKISEVVHVNHGNNNSYNEHLVTFLTPDVAHLFIALIN